MRLAPERNKYAEYTADFAPPPASAAWKGANETIRRWREDQKTANVKGAPYLFPDPGLILGCQDEFRRNCYLKQWRHMKDFWLFNARCSSQHVRSRLPLTPQQWRDTLSIGCKDETYWRENTAQPALVSVKNLLELCIKEADGTLAIASIHPFGESHPRNTKGLTSEECQDLLWELCQLGFQYELYYLHRKHCPPPPRESTSSDEYLECISRLKGAVLGCLAVSSIDIFHVDLADAADGLAHPQWNRRFMQLKAFHKLLCAWPGDKPRGFYDVPSDDEERSTRRQREDWERAQVLFYVQSYYDAYNRPPILPRTIYKTNTGTGTSRRLKK